MRLRMLKKFGNYLRLVWRLTWDKRVSIFLKIAFLGLPLLYLAVPDPFDVAPIVGQLDDLAFIILGVLIFTSLCPASMVAEHKDEIAGRTPETAGLEAFRYPDEIRDLAIGILVVIVILIAGGYLAGFFGLGIVLTAYFAARIRRGYMLSNVVEASPQQFPEIYSAFQKAQDNLAPIAVKLCIYQNPSLNAYTFGLDAPYTIVLTSGLVHKLNTDELQAVIGHEMGHILLGHVRLTNLMSYTVNLLFFKWARSSEYSADAIALQSCGGDPKPLISALLKITSGLEPKDIDLDKFLKQTQDSAPIDMLGEIVNTHPYTNKRIRRLVVLSQQTPSSGNRPAFETA